MNEDVQTLLNAISGGYNYLLGQKYYVATTPNYAQQVAQQKAQAEAAQQAQQVQAVMYSEMGGPKNVSQAQLRKQAYVFLNSVYQRQNSQTIEGRPNHYYKMNPAQIVTAPNQYQGYNNAAYHEYMSGAYKKNPVGAQRAQIVQQAYDQYSSGKMSFMQNNGYYYNIDSATGNAYPQPTWQANQAQVQQRVAANRAAQSGNNVAIQ